MQNNEIKKVCIKNCMCYYFDEIIKLEDFDIDNILIDEKSHKDILIYDNLYKTLIGAKPLCIRFNKIDGFIRIYDGTRYLTLASAIFYQIFIFLQTIALQKLWKTFFISSKKFLFSRYSNFCISVFHSFSPCQPLL